MITEVLFRSPRVVRVPKLNNVPGRFSRTDYKISFSKLQAPMGGVFFMSTYKPLISCKTRLIQRRGDCRQMTDFYKKKYVHFL